MDLLHNLDPLYALAMLLWLVGMGILAWLIVRSWRETEGTESNTGT